MRARLMVGALMACAVWGSQARAANATWHITKTEWTEADEKGFGDFVRAIADSDCDSSIKCLKSDANPYRATDPKFDFVADCADFAYMLRAYYAWKNGLPFTYVNEITGAGADIRFSGQSNVPVTRRNVEDGANAVEILNDIHVHVSSATYRMDAGAGDGSKLDFYSPKISPKTIHAGTVLYDINGHVATVYKTDDEGRIYYVDATPDHVVTRHIYGPQFGQSPAKLGGGFKEWRPIKLVGAHKNANGFYEGGHIVIAPNKEIEDFSLEQYNGNVEGSTADSTGALFRYNDVPLGFYEYVRVAMSGGKMDFNPVYLVRETVDNLCDQFKERGKAVDQAASDKIDQKPQPAHLPNNIYSAPDNATWESSATSGRDARLRYTLAEAYQNLRDMLLLWQQRDKRISYDGVSLKSDLQKAYADESRQCEIHYTNSAGDQITLGYNALVKRLFALDFDPYHCIERRWGATSGDELKSCKDDDTKSHWYTAEQRLRNQVERNDEHMGFGLKELENRAPGTGADDPPPVDLKQLIDGIGYQVAYQPMRPVGF